MSRLYLGADKRASRKAFTLIELLVVIGIIGVLLSILLPVLSKVHRAANTLACTANLHEILLAMQNYCSLYNDWLPGSPLTSSAFLFNPAFLHPPFLPGVTMQNPNYSDTYCPNVCGIFDWQSPLGLLMGMHFDTGPTLASRQSRFNFLMSQKAFACPENLWVADEFNNTSGVGQQFWNNDTAILMPSYFTAVDFLLQPNFVDNAKYNSTGLLEVYSPWATNELYFQLPAGYGPKLSKVGPPSRKIYIADGGLWSEAIAKGATPPATNIPNYTMEYMGAAPSSTCYSDYGAFDAYSRALSRGAASGSPPANITSALDATDPRLYGYRHGTLTPFGITNAYSFNAGFFDGHVETLSDLQGADPNMWNPPGTDIYPLEMMLDVQSTYFPQHVAGSTTPVVTN